jgi:homoserine dehydrogenase
MIMDKKKITIGIFGLGTVGSGVVELLKKQEKQLKDRYGLEINIKRIGVKTLDKVRSLEIDHSILTTNPNDILNDKEIDTVLELMGGKEDAYRFIQSSIANGKNVITANKAVLGEYGAELAKLVAESRSDCYFGFRAAITGLQDIIWHLYCSFTINKLVGVFNGTCNYILTEMSEKNKEFKDALSEAQQKGYAEQDPSVDIKGLDTADKLATLCMVAFKTFIKSKDINTEGIDKITLQDIKFAKELGYEIKLLGYAEISGNKLDARVCPALVLKDNMIARLRDVENGVEIGDDLRGGGGFTAPGAGKYPTASAVVADIINMATSHANYFPKEVMNYELQKESGIVCKYYFNFGAKNEPGVLESIAKVFHEHNINIITVLQKGESSERGKTVPLIVITDKELEKNIKSAFAKIKKLNLVTGNSTLMRVEEGTW